MKRAIPKPVGSAADCHRQQDRSRGRRMERVPIDSNDAEHSPRHQRRAETIADRCCRTTPSLHEPISRETCDPELVELISWYCSEPRSAFNPTVVLRSRFCLEQHHLAPPTITVRLAAVRRLAYDAADSGLLSPEPAAGIRRV